MSTETAHPRHAHVPAGRGRILRVLDERIEVKRCRNAGDRAGRVLAIFEPPGRMRELFEALDGQPADRLLDIAARHGLGVPGQ